MKRLVWVVALVAGVVACEVPDRAGPPASFSRLPALWVAGVDSFVIGWRTNPPDARCSFRLVGAWRDADVSYRADSVHVASVTSAARNSRFVYVVTCGDDLEYAGCVDVLASGEIDTLTCGDVRYEP